MDDEEYIFRMSKKDEFLYDVFLIRPVRKVDDPMTVRINEYIAKLRSEGKKVYNPAEDTDQVDETGGYRICQDNARAIYKSREVHIFFDPTSEGSRFDLGAAFVLGKTLVIANPEDVKPTEGKSFNNMIRMWHNLSLE